MVIKLLTLRVDYSITIAPAPASPTALEMALPPVPAMIIASMAVIVAEAAATVILIVGESMMESTGQERA